MNATAVTVIIMLVAMSFPPAGDTAGKLMAQAGVAPVFIAWSRFLLGALLVVPLIAGRMSEVLSLLKDWRVWVRGLMLVAGISSILTAVKTEPIANVFAAFFIGPILSYFLSGWLLREQISRSRTVLLLIGFCGVLLVVKPGWGMTPGIGYAVLAGVFYGLFLTSSRWLADVGQPRTMLMAQLCVGSIALMPFGMATLPEFSLELSALTFASALCSMLGNLLLIMAYRRMDASRLAPLVYFQLVAAVFFGLVFFSDFPDGTALFGMVILLGSGLLSFVVRSKP